MIQQLINKKDGFEIVRDKIAQILANEQASQYLLALTDENVQEEDWDFKVYTERSIPWGIWEEGSAKTPAVCVWFDQDSFDKSKGNVIDRQQANGDFNIDIIAPGYSENVALGGYISGDEESSRNAQRVARLVRNILMASHYVYLDLRGLVAERWVRSRTSFQPPLESDSVQHIRGVRVVLNVSYLELSPQYIPETLDSFHVDLKRDGDTAILAEYGFAPQA